MSTWLHLPYCQAKGKRWKSQLLPTWKPIFSEREHFGPMFPILNLCRITWEVNKPSLHQTWSYSKVRRRKSTQVEQDTSKKAFCVPMPSTEIKTHIPLIYHRHKSAQLRGQSQTRMIAIIFFFSNFPALGTFLNIRLSTEPITAM